MQTLLPILLLFLFMPGTGSALDDMVVYKTKTTIKRTSFTGSQNRVLTGYLVCYRTQDGWFVASLDRFTFLTNKFMEYNFFDYAYVGFMSNSLVKLNLYPSTDYAVVDAKGKTNVLNSDCPFSLSGKPQALTNRVTQQSVLMPKTLLGTKTADFFDLHAPFADGLPFDVLLSFTTVEKMTATYSQPLTEALQRSDDAAADAEAFLDAQRDLLSEDGYTAQSRDDLLSCTVRAATVSVGPVAARWAEWRRERAGASATPPAAAGADAHSRGPRLCPQDQSQRVGLSGGANVPGTPSTGRVPRAVPGVPPSSTWPNGRKSRPEPASGRGAV